MKKISTNNIDSSFQKCPFFFSKVPFSKVTFFTQEKGTLLPEKGHFANLGGPAPPPPVPMPLHTGLSWQSSARGIAFYL
jgi:hypothetical protein